MFNKTILMMLLIVVASLVGISSIYNPKNVETQFIQPPQQPQQPQQIPPLQVTVRMGQAFQVQPGVVQWVSVSCNQDEVPVGGGYNFGGVTKGITKDLRVTGESKAGNGWGIRADNYSTGIGTFIPIALCAKLV